MCIFVLSQCSLAVYSFTSFFNSFVSSDKHATHARHHQLENHIGHTDNRERDTERKRKRERYVVLLQLLFCFFCRVFLRANEDDVERRRTTTTSKEADDDEVDEQENGKDTSLKLRDDDECIETRQNDDE